MKSYVPTTKTSIMAHFPIALKIFTLRTKVEGRTGQIQTITMNNILHKGKTTKKPASIKVNKIMLSVQRVYNIPPYWAVRVGIGKLTCSVVFLTLASPPIML